MITLHFDHVQQPITQQQIFNLLIHLPTDCDDFEPQDELISQFMQSFALNWVRKHHGDYPVLVIWRKEKRYTPYIHTAFHIDWWSPAYPCPISNIMSHSGMATSDELIGYSADEVLRIVEFLHKLEQYPLLELLYTKK